MKSNPSLLTVCDLEYNALCERAYTLYLDENYNAELLESAKARLEILENSREQEQAMLGSDYRDAYSHLILGHYQANDFDNVERAIMEAIHRDVRVSVEAGAVILEALNRVDTLLEQHTQEYYQIIHRIDTALTGSVVMWDTDLEIPLYNETLHRATRIIHSLHCQLTLENGLETTANRSLNLINLSKTLLLMQKLCSTIFT